MSGVIVKEALYQNATNSLKTCSKQVEDLISKASSPSPHLQLAVNKLLHKNEESILPILFNTQAKLTVLVSDIPELISIARVSGLKRASSKLKLPNQKKLRRRSSSGTVPLQDDITHWNGYDAIIHLVVSCISKIEVAIDDFHTYPSSSSFDTLQSALERLGKNILRDIARMVCVTVSLAKNQSERISLFEEDDQRVLEQYNTIDAINREVFFGKEVGFYFLPTLKNFIETMTKALASFKYGANKSASLVNSLSAYIYYSYDPDSAAPAVVSATKAVDIGFLRSFWNLFDSSIMKHYFVFTEPSLSVDNVIAVPVVEDFVEEQFESLSGGLNELHLLYSSHDAFNELNHQITRSLIDDVEEETPQSSTYENHYSDDEGDKEGEDGDNDEVISSIATIKATEEENKSDDDTSMYASVSTEFVSAMDTSVFEQEDVNNTSSSSGIYTSKFEDQEDTFVSAMDSMPSEHVVLKNMSVDREDTNGAVQEMAVSNFTKSVSFGSSIEHTFTENAEDFERDEADKDKEEVIRKVTFESSTKTAQNTTSPLVRKGSSLVRNGHANRPVSYGADDGWTLVDVEALHRPISTSSDEPAKKTSVDEKEDEDEDEDEDDDDDDDDEEEDLFASKFKSRPKFLSDVGEFDASQVTTQCESNDDWLVKTVMEDVAHVPVRLLSHLPRKGMSEEDILNETTTQQDIEVEEMSDALIFHIHGGGFMAQSSKSHEIYLRQWAKECTCPVISIDYSAAPENPYPIALQECFYIYRYLLNQSTKFGTTANKIVVVGDSAGGNIAVALCYKCIMEGLRLPTVLMSIYAPLNLTPQLSPSRLLSIIDPLLPEGVLRACLCAYTPTTEEMEDNEEDEESIGHGDDNEETMFQRLRTIQRKPTPYTNDPLFNPMCAPDDLLIRLPPIHIVAAGLDPLLDDSISFATRCEKLGVPMCFKVFEDLPHGFLKFPRNAAQVIDAMAYCTHQIMDATHGIMDPDNT